MPIPKAELTPMWRQPNSRGYAGYSQGFGDFGDAAQDLLKLQMPWAYPAEEVASATARLNAMPSGGATVAQNTLDQAAQVARDLQTRIQNGSISTGYDTGGYYPTTGFAEKLKDPKVLAIGAAVLVGALLLFSAPKKKASAA